jgi:hypothetical protein
MSKYVIPLGDGPALIVMIFELLFWLILMPFRILGWILRA